MKINRRILQAAPVVAVTAIALMLSLHAQQPSNVQTAVNAAYTKYKTLQEGKNADYIPALAKVDPNIFGIALVTVDGKVYTTGDITTWEAVGTGVQIKSFTLMATRSIPTVSCFFISRASLSLVPTPSVEATSTG